MRFLGRSLTGLFLLATTLGLLALAGMQIASAFKARADRDSAKPSARERVFSANVIPFEPGRSVPTLSVFGELAARRALDVRARTGGTVVELAKGFETGGQVTKGQLLLRIDPSDLEASLKLAETDLDQAKADRRDAKSALALARDDLENARAQAELRAAALKRQRDLAARRVGTEAAVENAALADAAAKQTVLSRRQSVITAEARVATATATLSRREIALAEAGRRLDETQVYAEFAGTLSDVTALRGGVVTANEKLARIVDPTRLEVSFRLSTAQYTRLLDTNGVLAKSPVTIRLETAGAALSAKGKIARESATVGDGQTGRLIFATLDTARGFRPGDFVTVEVTEPPLDNVARLPASALGPRGTVLVLAEGNRLEEAPVALLRRQGDDVLVRANALSGRDVVSERTPTLGAGIQIKPVRAGAQPDTPDAPEMITLAPEDQAQIRAFVASNTRMPQEAKARILKQVDAGEMPADSLARIKSRIGG